MSALTRTKISALILGLLISVGVFTSSAIANAVDPSYGTQGNSYSGVTNPPTSDKPQSKLWWNAGSWWADMWTTGSGWGIYRLDRPTGTWVDTGIRNDTRASTLPDTLWDGAHLYIASHVVTISSDSSPKASVAGQPARLYRYSYSGGGYTLDAGFPTTITNNSSESMTIDVDSTGAVWATWTQVSGNATVGWKNTVFVNGSSVGGTSWPTPFVIPGAADPNPTPDDISSVVAFAKKKIGVMWTDQSTGTVYWATRTDGTSATASSSWNVKSAYGNKASQADDHLNIKALQSDGGGRVFAAVKTSLNDTSTDKTLAQLLLLVFKPGTGMFTSTTISTIGDCVSRPQVVLDTQSNLVRVFQTAPSTSVSGCPYSGVAGSIYEKTASMDNPVFTSGRGTPVIQDGSSANINDVTTSKQGVDNSTGLVILASNNVTKRYWFADRALGAAQTPPSAGFSASPTSGLAPLPVTFADTSTAFPTSWSWNFGDGTAISAVQNPSHTFTTAGTFTVTLTATNAGGSSTSSTAITVTAGTAVPTAAFSASPTSGVAPLPVTFTDTSAGSPTAWSWNFGDGTAISAVQNPSHTFTTAGTFTVTLTATNAGGSSTSSTAITVTAGTAVPTAAFSASPTSGVAPLPVTFTDTSAGSPTAWSWNFGDGTAISAVQNPSHTFTTAGTFTVTLTASNSAGANTTSKSIAVTPGSTHGISTGASTTTFAGAAATAVVLTKPAGVAAGDVLIASITADNNPTMSGVPTGWTPIVNALSVNSTSSAGARGFAYYHVVGSSDPTSYSWTLSSAQKWGAGVTAYRGVNTSSPLDSAVVTAVNTSFSGTSLTIPSTSTATNGAVLIGGVNVDSGTVGLVSPPAGWTQDWSAGGGQIAAQSHKVQATAGSSGTATWTLSSGRAFGGWRTALKPAS